MNGSPSIALSERHKFIGGSDIAAILGVSPWMTATDLWLKKTQPKPVDAAAQEANAIAKRRGQRLEPYIVDMIREEYGLKIVRRGHRYVDSEIDYFAAEIDAETEDENVEIKTVHPFMAKEWGEVDSDQLPIHYLAQTQWGLGVRGRDVCRVYALIGDDLRQYVVERDDQTIAAIRARAVDFWLRYVVPRVQPPLDFGDRKTLDTLRRLYPGTDGSTIVASEMHQHWRAVFEDAQAAISRYEAIRDGARAHLLAEMGEAAMLQFPDGKAFRRKLIAKKATVINIPASSYMDGRIVTIKE